MTGPAVGRLAGAHRDFDWSSVRAAVVGGLGVSGFAACDALLHLGGHVVVLDDGESAAASDRATLLEILGAEVRAGQGATDVLPDGLDLVVTAPGLPPGTGLFATARERQVPVWGEAELAWRLRPRRADERGHAPWLCVTGTNGKTTTVRMLESMLRAEGLRTVAAGNVGLALCEAVMDPEPYDVLAVELSSYQLHWALSLSAQAAVVLNVAPDHVSWHGDLAAYADAKAKIYQACQVACVYNVEDPRTRRMVEEAEVVEGCRAIGFTLGVPAVGMVGVVDGVLADRAFVEQRATSAAELGTVRDVPSGAGHNVANALAAAALARAHGVAPASVRRGLRDFRLDPHRIQPLGQVAGVSYVDDSKATNAHAAQASLESFEPVVWIAGGLAKGADFDDLVRVVRSRLRAVVLLGADRARIAEALRRHAPDVPVIDVPDRETEVMERVVAAAASVAVPGDTVLLAPACASQDLFADYAARGDAFAAAVAALRDR